MSNSAACLSCARIIKSALGYRKEGCTYLCKLYVQVLNRFLGMWFCIDLQQFSLLAMDTVEEYKT